jgi:hypothetical protein
MPRASSSPRNLPNFTSLDETLAPSDSALTESPPMKPTQPQPPHRASPPPRASLPRPLFNDISGEDKPHRRENEAGPNEQTLLYFLDGGRRPEVSQAPESALSSPSSERDTARHDGGQLSPAHHPGYRRGGGGTGILPLLGSKETSSNPSSQDDGNLQDLALGALEAFQEAVDPPPSKDDHTTDILAYTKELSIDDDRLVQGIYRTPTSATNYGPNSPLKPSPRSLTLHSPGSGLPPIVSPTSDSNGQSLPSIRSTLGDMKLPLSDQDPNLPHTGSLAYPPHSPRAASHQLPPMTGGRGTPPISPPESYHRSLSSPRSQSTSSPFSYANIIPHRPSIDTKCGSDSELSGAEKNIPTSSNISNSTAERVAADEITSQGIYICTVTGCKAPPFQTQYLLNSHANVHSSARPHYCPVPGCSRSEGGKGFKRKNEMIRHGLVHDSPGYVCPFCPDRDHKYPRPDNLQRHVRVHHVDKNKDDPLLREVLSQRSDGPNRGRRRRGGT